MDNIELLKLMDAMKKIKDIIDDIEAEQGLSWQETKIREIAEGLINEVNGDG